MTNIYWSPFKHCVQGLVNLIPTSRACGGNVMVPGSHKRFASIPEKYQRLARIHPTIDHFRFPNDDELLADTQPIICHLSRLLLWDSQFTAAVLDWQHHHLMTGCFEPSALFA